MIALRELTVEDLPRVAGLWDVVQHEGSRRTDVRELGHFLEQTLFASPWADPEIPSLVATDGDEIVGFLGSNVRRMRFDGRPVRMACSAHLLAHPRVRAQAVGARLLHTYLHGPQELTITDGANEPVRKMWEGLGGTTVHVSCVSFVQLLRPWQVATHRLARSRRLRPVEAALRPLARLLDAATDRIVPPEQAPGSEASSERLTPSILLEQLPAVAGDVRLVPDYDAGYLTWLFEALDDSARREPLWPDRVERGRLWAELVRTSGGVAGWYVCQLQRGGFCRVLQLAAPEKNAAIVLAQLRRGALANGAAGIYGRLEPRLVGPLSEQRTLLHLGPGRLLVSARDDAIVDAIVRGSALLTRMDGEWW